MHTGKMALKTCGDTPRLSSDLIIRCAETGKLSLKEKRLTVNQTTSVYGDKTRQSSKWYSNRGYLTFSFPNTDSVYIVLINPGTGSNSFVT